MNDLFVPLTRDNLQILSVTWFTLSYLDTRRRATLLVLPEMSRIAIKRAFSKNFGTYHYLFISYGTYHCNIILRPTKTTKKGSTRTARRTQRQMAWRRLNFPRTVNISRSPVRDCTAYWCGPRSPSLYCGRGDKMLCTTDAVTAVHRSVIRWVTAIFSVCLSELENVYGGRLQFCVIYSAVRFSTILDQIVFALPFAYIIFIFINNCCYFIETTQ